MATPRARVSSVDLIMFRSYAFINWPRRIFLGTARKCCHQLSSYLFALFSISFSLRISTPLQRIMLRLLLLFASLFSVVTCFILTPCPASSVTSLRATGDNSRRNFLSVVAGTALAKSFTARANAEGEIDSADLLLAGLDNGKFLYVWVYISAANVEA